MSVESKVLSDKELLEKALDYAKNLEYDFSNYYFALKLFKKEYIAKFGEVGSCWDGYRKIPVYQNAVTNEVVRILPTGGKIVDVARNHENYFKVEYIEELNMIMIGSWSVSLTGKYIKKDLGDFFFIDSKKRLISIENISRGFEEPKSYAAWIELICNGTPLVGDVEKMYSDAFSKLFPIAFGGGNHYFFVRNAWSLASFLKQKEVMKRSGPKQDKIDKLCSLEFSKPEVTFTAGRRSWWDRTDCTVVASRLNEEFACLRWYKKGNTGEIFETARLFVSKKEVEFCRINSFNEFIYINGKLNAENFRAGNFIIENDEVFKDTMLEYFKEAAEEVEGTQRILLLWLFAYYPLAEKMWKSPSYKQIPYNFVTQNCWGKFEDRLRSTYGDVSPSAKNINKALGVNNYQAEYALKPSKNYQKPIASIKRALAVKDIAFLDNNSFDILVKFFENSSWRCVDVISELRRHYPLKSVVRIANDFNNIEKDYRTISNYYDYLDMVSKVGDYNNFRPFFRNAEDIEQMHDAVMAIYELKRNAIKQDAFDKRSPSWKKWEYDKNEKFVVIAPTKPSDLAKEGTTLHHCVRTYIDRVADGRTNIMFIRKKEDSETPFFTVEITNDSTIQQVHGFGNRNANTEPGMVEFVDEWAKKCKLKTSSYNKIR